MGLPQCVCICTEQGVPAFLREATLAWECMGAQVVRREPGEEASMWGCEQDSRTVSGLLETPREAGAGPLCCLCCCLPTPVFSLSRVEVETMT